MGEESRSGLDWLLEALFCRRNPTAVFAAGDLGVRGVKELEDDAEDDGRGIVGLEEATVLTVLVGRAEETLPLLDGDGVALVLAESAVVLAALMSLNAAR